MGWRWVGAISCGYWRCAVKVIFSFTHCEWKGATIRNMSPNNYTICLPQSMVGVKSDHPLLILGCLFISLLRSRNPSAKPWRSQRSLASWAGDGELGGQVKGKGGWRMEEASRGLSQRSRIRGWVGRNGDVIGGLGADSAGWTEIGWGPSVLQCL